MPPHFTPTSLPPTPLHLTAISVLDYKQLVLDALLGFVSAADKDRATLHIHSNHSINTHEHPTPAPLGKVYKRALVVPPSSPHHKASSVHARHHTGWSLVGVLLRFTLQTV